MKLKKYKSDDANLIAVLGLFGDGKTAFLVDKALCGGDDASSVG